MSKRLLVLLIQLCILAQGCGRGAVNYLVDDARGQIKNSAIVLSVFQTKIDVVQEDNIGGGGLLEAAIVAGVNHKRNKNAAERLQIVRNALADYEFAEVLNAAFNKQCEQSAFPKIEHVDLVTTPQPNWQNEKFDVLNTDTVMFVEVTYRFTNSFNAIDVFAKVAMYPKTQVLKQFREKPKEGVSDVKYWGNSIYRNDKLSISRVIPNDDLDKDERVQLWSARNAEITKRELKIAAADLVTLIFKDLQKSS